GVLYLLHGVFTELPRWRPITYRFLSERLGQRVDCPVQHILLRRPVIYRRQMLVNPAVDADLITAAGEDRRDHLRMEQMAHRRNKERGGHLVLVQQSEYPRHAIDGAVLAA